jgi:AcrR family transcriptional regulator
MARTSKLGQVLVEATTLFATHGFTATSLHTVAERSKMTKTGLYYHIKGKQDLLSSICMQSIESIMAESGDASACADPVERLRRIVRTHAEFAMRNPEKVVVLQHERIHLSPRLRAVVLKFEKRYFARVRDTIEEAQRLGLLKPLDSGVAALTLIGALNALGEWYKPDGRLQADEVVAELMTMLVERQNYNDETPNPKE